MNWNPFQLRRTIPFVWTLAVAGSFGACADAGSTTAEEVPLLGLAEELRIGSLDDPEYAFGRIWHLVVGPNGHIYTTHPEAQEVREHDEAGRLVRKIGGEGEGPGEFKDVGTLGLLGDTLWTFDYRTYRISYFDTETGALIESVRTPVDLGDGDDEPPRPDGLLPDGTMLARTMAWSRLVASGEITESVLFRWTRDGEPIDTLAVRPLENTTWEVKPPDGSVRSYMRQPFTDAVIVAVSPTLPRVVIADGRRLEEGVAPEFHVTSRTFEGDTLFSRSFPYEPRPLTGAIIDSVVARRAESMSEWMEVSTANAAEWARASLYTPEQLPPVEGAVVGMDGGVWLRLTDEGLGSHRWLGLGPDGATLGELEAPREFRLMAATTDRWWGIETDDLDVPYIVRYAVGPVSIESELSP